jgi:hypothetical protein
VIKILYEAGHLIFHSQLHVVFRLLNQLVPLQLLRHGKPFPFVVPLILSERQNERERGVIVNKN